MAYHAVSYTRSYLFSEGDVRKCDVSMETAKAMVTDIRADPGWNALTVFHLEAIVDGQAINYEFVITDDGLYPEPSYTGLVGYYGARVRLRNDWIPFSAWRRAELIYNEGGRLIEFRIHEPMMDADQVFLVAPGQLWVSKRDALTTITITGVDSETGQVKYGFQGEDAEGQDAVELFSMKLAGLCDRYRIAR